MLPVGRRHADIRDCPAIVKSLVGVLGFLVLKTAISLSLGFTPSAPSITFLEYLVILAFATWLCARHVSHTHTRRRRLGCWALLWPLVFR
jgi:hypothetical protein